MKIIDTLGFFRYVDNWHRLPVIKTLLCIIGRHDWEFNGYLGQNGGELICMECCKKKHSWMNR